MTDETLRRAERAFAQTPDLQRALELFQSSLRSGEVDPRALFALLEDDAWARLDDTTRVQTAEVVAQRSPGLGFERLETHTMGGKERRVALFADEVGELALIPGGRATLGYAPGTFVPSPEQAESWADTEAEYEVTLADHLARCLSPVRTVEVAPFLLDTVHRGVRHKKRAEVTAALAADGFRLPTTDEWEYDCAAGTRTLFRWGDDCPSDRYPLSAGPPHTDPNSFGVTFGTDPYRMDLCEDGARGGDGGSAICGGSGFFNGWLSLSTWYYEDFDGFEAYGNDYYALRRVRTV